MVRFAIIGVVVGVALVLYALVDAAMSDPARARGVSKPVWVVMIVLLPVIGALLWLTIGKARGPAPAPVRAPDDDPRFTATRLSSVELDAHLEELEARLRELDDEVFPGDDRDQAHEGPSSSGAASSAEAAGSEPGTASAGSPETGGEARDAGSGRTSSGGIAPGNSAAPENDSSGEER